MSFRTFSSHHPAGHDLDVAVLRRMRPSSPMRALSLAVCLAGLSAMSCGSDSTGDTLDERSCQGEVGAECPATFDDALALAWTCVSSESIWAGECMTGGPLTLNRNWGTHQSNCFYDPTSRQLEGANVVNDTPTYCDSTSHSMSKGSVPVPYPHYCVGGSTGAQRSMYCQPRPQG